MSLFLLIILALIVGVAASAIRVVNEYERGLFSVWDVL